MRLHNLVLLVAGMGAGLTSALENRKPATPFVHPGVLMNRTQLETMKSNVKKGLEPWKSAYEVLLSNATYFNLSKVATPVQTCMIPWEECVQERVQAMSTYAMALAWYITGNQTYADKAIYFIDQWSPVMRGHDMENAALESGWVGSVWARSGEILRYSNSGWSKASIERFSNMLRTVYLPETLPGFRNYNGNWDLSMMDAAIQISVFLDDVDSYNEALEYFIARVPTYIYLEKDGAVPLVPYRSKYTTTAAIFGFWYNQTTLVDGLAQETCRDMEHAGYGIGAISHVLETVRIQGRDMFQEDAGTRLRYAAEFHSKYSLEPTPSWLCGGELNLKLVNVTEIAHSEFIDRLGYDLPYTQNYTIQQRPGGAHTLFISWETLTHGRLP